MLIDAIVHGAAFTDILKSESDNVGVGVGVGVGLLGGVGVGVVVTVGVGVGEASIICASIAQLTPSITLQLIRHVSNKHSNGSDVPVCRFADIIQSSIKHSNGSDVPVCRFADIIHSSIKHSNGLGIVSFTSQYKTHSSTTQDIKQGVSGGAKLQCNRQEDGVGVGEGGGTGVTSHSIRHSSIGNVGVGVGVADGVGLTAGTSTVFVQLNCV